MAITIKDIAREARVSITTVSRVVNRKDKGVGAETRKRVLEVIEKLNYSPNDVARSLVMKKTHVMGVIIPDITNPFFPELIRGVEDTASAYGYSILLCNSDDHIQKELKYISLLKEKGVDGIIYAGAHFDLGKETKAISRIDIPVVFLDRILKDSNYSYVCDDGEYGMKKIVQHLIEMGHEKIAYFGGNEDASTEKDRKKGYLKALQENGIPVEDELVFKGSFDIESGRKNIEKILRLKKNFTAIACANDAIAIGAMAQLRKYKICIPKDVSVTGYDDIEMAKYCYPALTTMAQDKYNIGKQILKMLVRIIKGEEKANASLELRSSLIKRDSVLRKGGSNG